MKIEIYKQEETYIDYQIKDSIIHRAKVPLDIKKWDYFNIYYWDSSKQWCLFNWDLEKSLIDCETYLLNNNN